MGKNLAKKNSLCKYTSLIEAVINNSFTAVKYFIEEKKSDVNATDVCRSTALMYAVKSKNLAMTKYLVDKGAEINVYDRHFETPLEKASFESFKITEYLIKKGAKMDVYDGHARNCLWNAIFNKSFKTFKLLLESCAEEFSKNNELLNEFLIGAASCGNIDIVKFLVEEKKCDVNAANEVDVRGCTKRPLREAITTGNLDLVKYLVSQGAEINICEYTKSYFPKLISSYLMGTILYRSLEIVEFLLEKGAKFHEDEYPLVFAAYCNEIDIVKFLAEKELYDVNETDEKGCSPLGNAISKGSPDLVEYLIKQGARFNKSTLIQLNDFLIGLNDSENSNSFDDSENLRNNQILDLLFKPDDSLETNPKVFDLTSDEEFPMLQAAHIIGESAEDSSYALVDVK